MSSKIINIFRIIAYMEGFNHAKERDHEILNKAGDLIKALAGALKEARKEADLLREQVPGEGEEGAGRRPAGVLGYDVHAAVGDLLR